jgi:predicted RNA-binding protein
MKYWLCITTKNNWDISEKNRILGFKEIRKNQVSKIFPGDEGFVYVKHMSRDTLRVSSIIAKFEITSELFYDETPIFIDPSGDSNEIFPYRCKINILKIAQPPFSFKNLVPELDFISNKKRWGLRLMGQALIKLENIDADVLDRSFA